MNPSECKTKKGREVMANMKDEYGKEKGEEVFWASKNKGKIKGVTKKSKEESSEWVKRDPRVPPTSEKDREAWLKRHHRYYKKGKYPKPHEYEEEEKKEESMDQARKNLMRMVLTYEQNHGKQLSTEELNFLQEEEEEVNLGKKGHFKVKKGAYHKATGIPEGEPIPMSRIDADIKKGGHIGRMAKSAKGFKSMHHGESAVKEMTTSVNIGASAPGSLPPRRRPARRPIETDKEEVDQNVKPRDVPKKRKPSYTYSAKV